MGDSGGVGPVVVQYDPPRAYARGSRVGGVVFLAGETGIDHASGHLAGDGIREQAEQAFVNLRDSLAVFGLGLDALVKMDVFLRSSEHRIPFMEVLRRHLPDGAPPGALLCVGGFAHEGVLVEIECVAAAADGPG